MRPSRKRWLFRWLAIGLAMLPFVAAEATLRWLGVPQSPVAIDPYVDLHHLRPLFVATANGTQMEIPGSRMELFRPATFGIPKPAETFRVFALGGSTTQGEPYSTETAFPKWLELALAAASKETRVEAINCGGLSYASYRVLAILKEVLNYEPDLIVVYTGQNEYLERRSYAGLEPAGVWRRATSSLAELRMVQLTKQWLGTSGYRREPSETRRTQLAAEVDALLDYQGGLADYHRDDDWHAGIQEHFRWNLEQMVFLCRQAGVPLVLVGPVSNLLDCPPMKFEPRAFDDPAEEAAFNSAWETARTADSREIATQAAEQAYALDPEHAGVNYLLGKLLYAAGDGEAAKQFLVRAKDTDVCPLRCPTPLLEVIYEVAATNAVPLVSAEQLFSDRSEHGLVGRSWLVDHVHPTVEGHQLLGKKLARRCLELGLFPPDATGTAWAKRGGADSDRAQESIIGKKDVNEAGSWDAAVDARFAEHLGQLGEDYFQRGKQRLEGLILWTQGRAKKIRDSN